MHLHRLALTLLAILTLFGFAQLAPGTNAQPTGGRIFMPALIGRPLPPFQIIRVSLYTPGFDYPTEYVEFTNTTSARLNLAGWTITAFSSITQPQRPVYTFPTFQLAPGARLQLYTVEGTDDHILNKVYWNRNSFSYIWTPGDVVELRNPAGEIIQRYVIPPPPAPTSCRIIAPANYCSRHS